MFVSKQKFMQNFIDELKWRGLLQNMTEGCEVFLRKYPDNVRAYIGFDPTAPSLGIGNLVQIAIIRHLINCGHKDKVIILLGSTTAKVGDPSGKLNKREQLDGEVILENSRNIVVQIRKLLPKDKIQFIDNWDISAEMYLKDFLVDICDKFNVREMLAKSSVKQRMDSNEGISLKEFMYSVPQAYDFYWLYENKNVNLQIGGSDQWGNITAGTELIRKIIPAANVHGIVTHLITKSDGTKFGKTEEGNIWLDPTMTSPYEFYQFWYNLSDEDAEKMYLIFSQWDETTTKDAIEGESVDAIRKIQFTLATEMVNWVHGKICFDAIISANKILFDKERNPSNFSLAEWKTLEQNIPTIHLKSYTEVMTVEELLILSQIKKGTSDVTRGMYYLNEEQVDGLVAKNHYLGLANFIHNKYMLVRVGKKKHYLIILE